MTNENTLNLDEYLYDLVPPGHSYYTLAEFKESLDQFFDRNQVTGKTIAQIRVMIGEGRLIGYDIIESTFPYGECGCIKGLYTLITGDPPFTFYKQDPSSSFEALIYDIEPGMTPQNNPLVAQADAVLALCQAERSTES